MKRIASQEIVVAIDVGTTKICVLVAQVAPDNSLNILGIGQAPSAGLARGVVVTMAPAVHAVQAALREAELMAGVSLESAYVGISGAHIRACSSHGMIAIKHGEIQQHDVTNVLQAAQAITLPEGQQILHAMPHYFCINGNEIVANPLGMYGVRLEARVHIVTGAIASVQNLIRCCELAGIKVQDIILEPIASADAVLSTDERELGVGILDIGGGTSDFAVYQKGAICHTHIIPLAGNVFTHDLAVCLHVSLQDAERIKRLYGMIPPATVMESNTVVVACVDGREETSVTAEDIATVITPRSEEILLLLAAEIERHSLRSCMPTGLVLTGGGSLLTGMREQALNLLRMPVRIGRPTIHPGMMGILENPIYATAYGLLIHAQHKRHEELFTGANGPLWHKITQKMKSWIFEMF